MAKSPRGRGAVPSRPQITSRWVWVGKGPIRYALEWYEQEQPTGRVEEFDGMWSALRFAEAAAPPVLECGEEGE